jgi:dTDP-4-amino-4,6-dideoxygalactose transaminase
MTAPALAPNHRTPALYGGVPAFSEKFRFIAPQLPPLENVLASYSQVFRSGIITNAKCVSQFEEAAAAYIGVRHCVAVSSCTSGLMLVMRALGMTGEVILPSFTFFATAHAAHWNSLELVLADCDTATWNIDIADVERKITSRTSAIVAVHMYGNPNDVRRLEELAAKHGLKLIFDAAHAFGSRHRNQPIGQFGDAEIFSLSPTKLLVAGEGGLISTNNAELAAALRIMRNYGDSGSYDPEWIGLNARMPEFNAALATAGIPLLAEKIARRNQIAALYTEGLRELPGITFQQVDPRDTHTFKDYSIHITRSQFGMTRDQLAQALLAENIETKRYFYPPLHKQKHYKQFLASPLPGTDWVADNVLSLPIYETLPDDTVKAIVDRIHLIHSFTAPRLSDNQRMETPYVLESH